jgi:hypothetical protein
MLFGCRAAWLRDFTSALDEIDDKRAATVDVGQITLRAAPGYPLNRYSNNLDQTNVYGRWLTATACPAQASVGLCAAE